MVLLFQHGVLLMIQEVLYSIFTQEAVILGFTIKDSAVSQIFATSAGIAVPLNQMQTMRNYFTYGTTDYTGQDATGVNISITYAPPFSLYYAFIDSVANSANLRWQAVLAY